MCEFYSSGQDSESDDGQMPDLGNETIVAQTEL